MACPYIHRNDERCFLQQDSQEGIDLAYKYCYDRYRDCRIFAEFEASATSVRSAHPEDHPKPVQVQAATEVKSEAPAPYHHRLPADPALEMVKQAFREVLRELEREGEEEIGERWRGGTLVLRPRDSTLAAKEVPVEVFFGKLIMLRDRLRVLEQKVNGHEGLSTEDKLVLQQYVTRCYGSLTTFNVLFRDRTGWFVGERGS
ncbi:MAG: hypothetical protein HY722_12365 [Planctomycetes bacterium]|nr:hypothetical protein [Planctomycetota bacterium]